MLCRRVCSSQVYRMSICTLCFNIYFCMYSLSRKTFTAQTNSKELKLTNKIQASEIAHIALSTIPGACLHFQTLNYTEKKLYSQQNHHLFRFNVLRKTDERYTKSTNRPVEFRTQENSIFSNCTDTTHTHTLHTNTYIINHPSSVCKYINTHTHQHTLSHS